MVFPLALGCMGMSDLYGPADEAESIATIHAALDAGITLLDTGDYYAAGHNELLIERALRDRRDKALVSVKFGALRAPDGSWLGMDTRPIAMRNFLAYSLTRLGLDHVDIYRPGRLDPNVPIEDTVGAIADLVQAGYVRAIGLSEVRRTPSDARRRSTESAISRSSIPRRRQFCPQDTDLSAPGGARHRRDGLRCAVARPAQWLKARVGQGLSRVSPALRAVRIAGRTNGWLTRCRSWRPAKGVTLSQLAIAWVLAKGRNIVPLDRRAKTNAAGRIAWPHSRSGFQRQTWQVSKRPCRHQQ